MRKILAALPAAAIAAAPTLAQATNPAFDILKSTWGWMLKLFTPEFFGNENELAVFIRILLTIAIMVTVRSAMTYSVGEKGKQLQLFDKKAINVLSVIIALMSAYFFPNPLILAIATAYSWLTAFVLLAVPIGLFGYLSYVFPATSRALIALRIAMLLGGMYLLMIIDAWAQSGLGVSTQNINLVQQHVRSFIGLCYLFFWGSIFYNLWKFIFFDTEKSLDIFTPGRNMLKGIVDVVSSVPGFQSARVLNKTLLPDNMLSTESRLEKNLIDHFNTIKGLVAAGKYQRAYKMIPKARAASISLMDLDNDLTNAFKGRMNERLNRVVGNSGDQRNMILFLHKKVLNPLEQALLMAVQADENLQQTVRTGSKSEEKKAREELHAIQEQIMQLLSIWASVNEALMQKHTASMLEAAALAKDLEDKQAAETAAAKEARETKAAAQKTAEKSAEEKK